MEKRKVRAKVILAESCYSAAFAQDFKKLLTPNGIMQLETLECTPGGASMALT
jgi:hypothetical protein